jgi:hypothetical protein
MHSYMTWLDFAMELPFECPECDVGDMAFIIKATRSICGRDVVEKYMACELFPLSANFGLGKIEDSETAVSKLTLPLPKFPVARLLRETNDNFRARVELAAVNVVGRYARGELDTCIVVVPNNGQVNRVFEQASMPYGPRLVPGSEASIEAAKKRKSDSGAEPMGKRVKASDRKVVPLKAHVASKGAGATSSKTAMAKAAPTKSLPRASAAASVPPKACAP